MTENESIKKHNEECEHRIGNILGFMESNSDADTSSCEKNISVLKAVIIALEELLQYRAIGTVEECRDAVERMKPKKPTYEGDGYAPDGTFVWDEWLCPNCGNRYEVDCDDYVHCPNCGQAIDWREERENEHDGK